MHTIKPIETKPNSVANVYRLRNAGRAKVRERCGIRYLLGDENMWPDELDEVLRRTPARWQGPRTNMSPAID